VDSGTLKKFAAARCEPFRCNRCQNASVVSSTAIPLKMFRIRMSLPQPTHGSLPQISASVLMHFAMTVVGVTSPLHQQPFRPDSPTHRSGYPLFAMGLRPLGPESPSRQTVVGDGPWRLQRHRGFTLGLFQQTSYAWRSRRTSVASRKNPRPNASGMIPNATAFHTSGSLRAISAKAIM